MQTPIGEIFLAGNDHHIYLLEFSDGRNAKHAMDQLQSYTQSEIKLGKPFAIESLEKELTDYFSGRLKTFKTPLFTFGSPFRKRVWDELIKIPYGETRSYAEIAQAIGHPTAFRAVAQANGANRLSIVIPCHRVINSNGALGGYGGGISRKEWLLQREKN